MSTRKPRLQLEKFAINGAKRLLQHNLPEGSIGSPSLNCASVLLPPMPGSELHRYRLEENQKSFRVNPV